MTDVSKMTDDYIKSLQALGSATANGPSFVAPVRKGNFLNDFFNLNTSGITTGGPENVNKAPGLGSQILDFVERPAYAVKGALGAAINGHPGDILGAFGRGLSGQDKPMGSDILKSILPTSDTPLLSEFNKSDTESRGFHPSTVGGNNVANALGGFVLDTAADPLSYVGPGAVKGVVKGFSKLGSIAKTAPEINDTAVEALAHGQAVDPGTIAKPQVDIMRRVQELTPNADQTKYNSMADNVVKNAEEPKGLTAAEVSKQESDILTTDARKARIQQMLLLGKPVAQPDVLISSKIPEVSKVIPFGKKGDYLENKFLVPSEELILAAQAQDAIKSHAAKTLAAEGAVTIPNHATVLPQSVQETIAKTLPTIDKTPGRVIDNAAQANIVKSITSIAGKVYDAAPTELNRIDFINGYLKTHLQTVHNEFSAAGRYPETKVFPTANATHHLTYQDALDTLPSLPQLTASVTSKNGKFIPDGPHPQQVLAGIAQAAEIGAPGMGYSLAEKFVTIRKAMAGTPSPGHEVNSTYLDVLAKDMARRSEDLHNLDIQNSANTVAKDAVDSKTVAEKSIPGIQQAAKDPTLTNSQVASELADISRTPKEVGKAIGASDSAIVMGSQQAAQAFVRLGGSSFDVDALRALSRQATDRMNGNMPKVAARFQSEAANINKEATALAPELVADPATRTFAKASTGFSRVMHAINEHLSGKEVVSLQERLRAGTSPWQYDHTAFVERAIKPMGAWDNEYANAVHSAHMSRQTPVDPKLAADVKLYAAARNAVFDDDPAKGYFGVIFNNGATASQINHILDTWHDARTGKGISKTLRIDLSSKKSAADQIRAWRYTDPVEALNQLHAATGTLAMRSTIARDFADQFGSTVKNSTHSARIIADPASYIAQYLPKTHYFDSEAIKQVEHFEKIMKIHTSFRGEHTTVAAFVNNFLDPVMRMWKPWATIARPGHHVRNFMGDVLLSTLDGVVSPSHYADAMHIMRDAGRIEKTTESIAEMSRGTVKPGGNVWNVRLKGGKTIPVGTVEAYQKAHQTGLLTSFVLAEDLGTSVGNGILDKMGNLLADNRYISAMGHVAETTTHATKLAHFSALMKRPSFTRQFATLDEAALNAAIRVKRFHPDPQGLTRTEQRYMRRLDPFYSWTRQAIPLVFETLLTNPGRVLALPKASYAVAEASGMNPRSFTDQFPADQQFPAFVKESITGPLPLGGWGQDGTSTYNLGSAQEGVLGSGGLNGNISRNILAMLNPIFKAPIDLASGQNLGTGKPIADKSDYVDATLPVVNQIAGISGFSPSGTFSNLVGGTPAKGFGTLDPQRAMQQGQKAAFLNQTTLNFLTGLGIQDVTRPSYEKIAKMENRGQ